MRLLGFIVALCLLLSVLQALAVVLVIAIVLAALIGLILNPKAFLGMIVCVVLIGAFQIHPLLCLTSALIVGAAFHLTRFRRRAPPPIPLLLEHHAL